MGGAVASSPPYAHKQIGKSEQFRYNPLEGERDQPQISVDAEALYELLIRAETMVSKVDRIRYIHRQVEKARLPLTD